MTSPRPGRRAERPLGQRPDRPFYASGYESAIAGEVKDFAPEDFLPAEEARYMDRNVQFACAAALEALRDAGIEIGDGLGPSAGVVVGSGAGGHGLLEEGFRTLNNKGPRRFSPFFLTNFLPDASTGHIAILTGAMGPTWPSSGPRDRRRLYRRSGGDHPAGRRGRDDHGRY